MIRLVLLAALIVSTNRAEISVVRVIDGDTFVAETNGVEFRVRLYGVNCPERGEPGGAEATAFTEAAITNGGVVVEFHGRDRYGRTVGRAIVNGEDLGVLLILSGNAEVWGRYIREAWLREEYLEIENNRR